MPFDLFQLADNLPEDATIELQGQKYTGAEIRAFANQQRQTLSEREAAIQAERQARQQVEQRFQQFEGSTSALLRAAAAAAAQDDGGQQQRQAAPAGSDEFAVYENDPLFGPYTKGIKERMIRELDSNYFKPWVEKQFQPAFQRLEQTNRMLTQAYLDERQQREYKELNEWPEKFGLADARKYGEEKNYFLPGTAQQDPQTGRWVGVVDLHRVHSDVMGPVLSKRNEERIRKETEEQTLQNLRKNFNVVPLPNRSVMGNPPVIAKGKTAEEIFGNAIEQAANDPETQRGLMAVAGSR